MNSLPETKVCTKCHEKKLIADHFTKNKASKDGLDPLCRGCKSVARREHYAKNIERERAQSLEWYRANRDKAVQSMKDKYWNDPDTARARVLKHYYDNHEEEKSKWRDYYAENKEALKPAREAWQEANKEEILLKKKQYRQNNPDKVRKDTRARRARLLSVVSENYLEQDVFNRWGTDCHICGEPIDLDAPRKVGADGWERGLHLDHVIPLVAGGADIVENVKPAHGLCNLRKSKSV
jgi:hypothetical protein